MIAKLLALFQNRPSSRMEELVTEALRREARSEHSGSTVGAADDEQVRKIMSAIAASPPETDSQQSPSTGYLIPVFGSLSAMALVLFVFISLSEKDKPVSPIHEQTNHIKTPKIETFPLNHSAERLPEKSLNALREAAYTFPLAVEATRLKRDVRRGTDSLLAIVVPLRDLVNTTPSLSVPALPSFQNTPYQTELDNLWQDTKQAIDFIEGTLSVFNG